MYVIEHRQPDELLMFEFSRFPTIATKRLVMREVTPADGPAVLALRGNFEIARFNNSRPITTLEEAYDLIVAFREDYREQRAIHWGITLKTKGDVIGTIAYVDWNKTDSRARLDYELDRPHWGYGLVSETLRSVAMFGFHQLALNRIEVECPDFDLSSVTALKNAGFTEEGRQREKFFQTGHFYDLLLYGLLRRDFLD